MGFRLLDMPPCSAFDNMAIDEAILQQVSIGASPPTLRLYGWKPSAVSIGYFQSIEDEVDLDACLEKGFDVVRRITGGGAVFHDDELTYSIIIPEASGVVSEDIMGSYAQICGAIVDALGSFGLEARFKPVNDITVDGKKISGNAQTRRCGCVLQHGTLILGLDADEMFSVLKVPDEKIRDKMIATVKDRVTSLRLEYGGFSDASVRAALVEGFEGSLGISTAPGELTLAEKELAGELSESKYSTRKWNFKR